MVTDKQKWRENAESILDDKTPSYIHDKILWAICAALISISYSDDERTGLFPIHEAMTELLSPFDEGPRGKDKQDRYFERKGRIEHWRWRQQFPPQWILIKIVNTIDNNEMEFANDS